MTPLASFDPVTTGYRFTLRYLPHESIEPKGTIVIAPAFAEEMNRCRRMTALAARRLAELGWTVIERDLLGCGDSSGDFADASLQAWTDDLSTLVETASPEKPLWILAIRGGALLVPPLLDQRPDANVILWQPVVSGQTMLNQFLRLKTAAAVMAGDRNVDTRSLRSTLAKGRSIEVAGYILSPELVNGADRARLQLPSRFTGRVVWLEVSATAPVGPSPAGEKLRQEWVERGVALSAGAVTGEQFWQTQETAECLALIEAMLELMDSVS
jgi:exosortase A-associated hydrolase 2